MKRSTNVELDENPENSNCDASGSENNFDTNNCSKLCSAPIGGVRAKVKQHFCNIGSDSLKVNKSLNLGIQNGNYSKYGGVQNGATHLSPSSSSSPSPSQASSAAQRLAEKEGSDIDYYVRHNVDCLNSIEKCPTKVGNQSLENKTSNGNVSSKLWNLRDDESSSGNEADEALSDHECCIYTYKGDQFADLPSSFFKLDFVANGSDQAADLDPPKELAVDENERSQSGSSPEMDFLEMDFDPGPSIEQDSEEEFDCYDCKPKTDGNISPVPELPNEQVTENDLSKNLINDTELNIVTDKLENVLGISSNFKNPGSPEPQPGPSSIGLTAEISEKTSCVQPRSIECNNNSSNGSASNNNFSRLCWPARDSWGHHYSSGDLCSPGDASEVEQNDSLGLWNAGNLKIQGDMSHDTRKYNLHSALYHCIMAKRLVIDKKTVTDGSNSCFESMVRFSFI